MVLSVMNNSSPLKVPQVMTCFITNFHTSEHIEVWAQKDGPAAQSVNRLLEDLHVWCSDHLAAQYSKPVKNLNVEVGKNYLSRMKGDLRWYRCVVMHICNDEAFVSFMDHGNEEWVDANKLISCESAFAVKPLASKYFLADVYPVDRNRGWNRQEVKRLLDEFLHKTLKCEVIRKQNNTGLIRIYDDDFNQPFVNKLIQSGIAYHCFPPPALDFNAVQAPLFNTDECQSVFSEPKSMNVSTPKSNEFYEGIKSSSIRGDFLGKNDSTPKSKELRDGIKSGCIRDDPSGKTNSTPKSKELHERIKSNYTQNDPEGKIDSTPKDKKLNKEMKPNYIRGDLENKNDSTLKSKGLFEAIDPNYIRGDFLGKSDSIPKSKELPEGIKPTCTRDDSSSKIDSNPKNRELIKEIKSNYVENIPEGKNDSNPKTKESYEGIGSNLIRDDLSGKIDSNPINRDLIKEIKSNSIEGDSNLKNKELNEGTNLNFVENDLFGKNGSNLKTKELHEEIKSNSIENDSNPKSKELHERGIKSNSNGNDPSVKNDSTPKSKELNAENSTCIPTDLSVKKESSFSNSFEEMAQDLNLFVGKTRNVLITEIRSNERFYCYLSEHESILQNMHEDMLMFYNENESNGKIEPDADVQMGSIIACKNSDGYFYRAKVLSHDKENSKIHVFYIDYGNEECVCIEICKKLKASFTELSPQSIPCMIANNYKLGSPDEHLYNEFICKFIDLSDEGFLKVYLCNTDGIILDAPPLNEGNMEPEKEVNIENQVNSALFDCINQVVGGCDPTSR